MRNVEFKLTFADSRLFIRGHGRGSEGRKFKKLFEIVQKLSDAFKDQTTDQNIKLSTMAGFNFEELFGEEAEPIPNYLMQGCSEKIQLNLWDGFHKTCMGIVKEFLANPEESNGKLFSVLQSLAPILPLFVTNVNGKFDTDIKSEDLESIMGLPQAAMAQMNVHSLLSSMSPWGTLDDQELIANDDEDGDAPPIWSGFKDREEWGPKEVVDAFLARMVALLTSDGQNEELVEGMNSNQAVYPKLLHVLSMIADDGFEAEFGFEIKQDESEGQATTPAYAHGKFDFSGAGFGKVCKALLIAKMASGGF